MGHLDTRAAHDRLGLRYPSLGVVFIQTFSLNHLMEFVHDYESADADDDNYDKESDRYISKAEVVGKPRAYVNRDIENQIFVLPESDGQSNLSRRTDHVVSRYSLPGFDFEMDINPPDGESLEDVTLAGHVNVEMSLFFDNTLSLTYRFLFNGNVCTMSKPLATDHVIVLLSTWLGAEFWSDDQEGDGQKTDINYEAGLKFRHLPFDARGKYREYDPEEEWTEIKGKGYVFEEIAQCYKSYIYNHCTKFRKDAPLKDISRYRYRRMKEDVKVTGDHHYAMVDVWEDISHPLPEGVDLFATGREDSLSEADIVTHVRDFHRSELIGLLSLYPEEWPYRDDEAYDEVCGVNIAIDTDDLVLAGNNLCLVIGTYGRRGKDTDGVDWEKHLLERKRYHVSWPEYLMLLQLVLAKKHILGIVRDELVASTLGARDCSSQELIGKNAELSLRLTRLMLQLDVIKYSKFTSHKVMYERTSKRFALKEDEDSLRNLMDTVDSSLHNISDYKSMKSEFLLNIILGIVSVASTFELLFQNSEMPFLTHFGIESSRLAAVLVAVVASITIFAILLVVVKYARAIIERIKSYF